MSSCLLGLTGLYACTCSPFPNILESYHVRNTHKPTYYVMASTGKTLFRRNRPWKSPSSAPSRSGAAVTSPLLNRVVFLHEWWLIKTDSDSQGRRLGVAGTSQEKQGARRSFLSAPIVKRDDTVTLKTADGVTIMVHGLLDKSRTLKNGFSHKVCDHFVIGFPYDWEEYAAVSFDEHENPVIEDHECGAMQKFFDDILQQSDGSDLAKCVKKETSSKISPMVSTPDKIPAKNKNKRPVCNLDSVKRSGPLTRSRVRLLDN